MGGFQRTSVTALPSATDEGCNSQKRPYSTLINSDVSSLVNVVSTLYLGIDNLRMATDEIFCHEYSCLLDLTSIRKILLFLNIS